MVIPSHVPVPPRCRQPEQDMRILVIDDEPDVLMLCRVNLELAGHEVIEAGSGEAGLELARDTRPDVVVLDVMLPRRDGYQVIGDLSSEQTLRDVPVILLTAKTQTADRLAGWRAGCAEFVTKPFSPLELVEAVARVHAMTAEERSEHRRNALARLGDRAEEASG
jgi:two-component system alkaline phosphatase synthesis response regulator PhoP